MPVSFVAPLGGRGHARVDIATGGLISGEDHACGGAAGSGREWSPLPACRVRSVVVIVVILTLIIRQLAGIVTCDGVDGFAAVIRRRCQPRSW